MIRPSRGAAIGVLLIGAMLMTPAAALVPAAEGAEEYRHPLLFRNELVPASGERVPYFGAGTIVIDSEALRKITCVNLIYGVLWNGTEKESPLLHTYGEVLEWTGTGYLNNEHKEAGERCNSQEGFEVWGAVEPPLNVTTEIADIGYTGEGSEKRPIEREVIKQASREPPTVPWKQQAIGELSEVGEEIFHLQTGLGSTTCYPGAELVERQKNATERETEERLKPAPQGCVRINMVIPQFGFEVEFQGSLDPVVLNGFHNGLHASQLQFGYEQTEKLESVYGPATVKSELPLRFVGFAADELLTVGERL